MAYGHQESSRDEDGAPLEFPEEERCKEAAGDLDQRDVEREEVLSASWPGAVALK